MLKERKDIEQKYKWDLSVIYPDEAAFYADYAVTEKMIKAFKAHEKTMCKSAQGLYNTLKGMCDIEEKIQRLWQYAMLSFSVDTSDNNAQALTAKVRNLAVEAGTASWFVSPFMIKLDTATLNTWFEELPVLETFRRTVELTMKNKPHTLSDESEQLISRMEDCLGSHDDIRSIFANSDLRFGKIRNEEGKLVELTDTNYVPFLMNSDRRVRQAAFRALYKTYEQFGNTFATIYNGKVKEACTLAKIRNFKNSITASTFGDEVTPEIYNNLIATVNKGMSTVHDYYALKREVLGVDKLHLYDVYAPLVSGEITREYSYEEAVDEVLKTVDIYGSEYADTLRAGLTEKGWVDVYPTRGKRGGAFSAGTPYSEPYIMLNYTGTLNDVSTLAHEAGHSMHTYFSSKYNEPHNASYTIFVAEVASTVNELLLNHRQLRECQSDDEKLYILNELMETYKSTLYRQTMFAEFERDMHAFCEKGEPLTAELINKHYYKLIKKYFGRDVKCDKPIAYEWMRIPHFFSCFYVYKYATCISAASAIVKRIETEGETYVQKYIDFLKCGGSRSPLDSLLVAEIDMTKPEVVSSAIEDFASAIAQFREIYNKNKA
ncbi:MAG: oligoendopeptidase F [Ruminococcaceae bacterium]|nr:oligoendopeptidase F [Oscillospiraceae bacterium]